MEVVIEDIHMAVLFRQTELFYRKCLLLSSFIVFAWIFIFNENAYHFSSVILLWISIRWLTLEFFKPKSSVDVSKAWNYNLIFLLW